MEAKDIVQSLEKFFLDIVGTVVPGALQIVVFGLFLGFDTLKQKVVPFQDIAPLWLVFLVLSFVLGHVVSSIGQILLIPFMEILFGLTIRIPFVGKFSEKILPQIRKWKKTLKRVMFTNFS